MREADEKTNLVGRCGVEIECAIAQEVEEPGDLSSLDFLFSGILVDEPCEFNSFSPLNQYE